MLQKLGLVDLVKAIQKTVETNTGLRCYDAVPLNAPSPFYFAEVVGQTKADNKTLYRDIYTVYIHCIAKPSKSSVEVYNLVQKLEEALTENITLADPFYLLSQTSTGLANIQTDETEEKHAIVGFEFMVAYGFKTKV